MVGDPEPECGRPGVVDVVDHDPELHELELLALRGPPRTPRAGGARSAGAAARSAVNRPIDHRHEGRHVVEAVPEQCQHRRTVHVAPVPTPLRERRADEGITVAHEHRPGFHLDLVPVTFVHAGEPGMLPG